MGNVLNKFGCSKHLEFPNGVVVNDRQEIFISDNRAHCVKVFNYEGQYMRQIGGEGKAKLTFISAQMIQRTNFKKKRMTQFCSSKPCIVSAGELVVLHTRTGGS